jgi:ArsR family transcriptional regulator
VLREAGWISGERRGTWIWYSLRPEAVARFRHLAASIEPADASSLAVIGPASRRLPVLQRA